MPLLTFDVIQGRSESEIRTLLDAAHRAVLTAFKVPARDRYQIVHENKRYQMVFQDTGLGFERTDNLVMVRVYTSPRSEEQKTLFMAELARELQENCGVQGNDLMISFITNSKGDWSFADGEAQYLTGKL
ncbi:tautomerase family protein [Pantoea sp. JGM49]|jgi:UDP-N-acetylmuramate-alanine ligase|uniref:Tautomerase family protein n=1 Tax=Candidatus Pantoea communis TaxID=2608354 RepID=A0ABX0S0A3_9GAMM|nr:MULTISPECIES: tautomerase family protein [Enterobacterales]MDF7628862.1 tautomerase family protein [Erwiniaceae bacterium L1_55_4]HAU5565897.1 tautomerase family protein [Serratia fonticola]KGT89674.1 tautomerase [Enterobacter cancerogenus]KJV29000.1 tautomerase [Pantoea sp. SM3]KJV48122.1 tautomerase [Pantoea sp. BL1]